MLLFDDLLLCEWILRDQDLSKIILFNILLDYLCWSQILFIQLGIDLVFIAAKIIFSVVIIQVGILTFQFLKSKFLCCSNKAFLVFLRPTIDPRSYNTGQSNKLQGRSQDFLKGGSHCVKVRVLTRLSCRPPRRVSA